MLKVSVYPPVVRKSMAVVCTVKGSAADTTAVLVNNGGEKVRTFFLPEVQNELTLDGLEAGTYTLRIESGGEVMAKQIFIP